MRRASSRRRWKFVSRAQHATRRGGDSAVLTRGQSKNGVSGEGIGFSSSPLPGSDVRDSSAPHVRLRAGIPLAPRDRAVSRSQRLTRTSSRLRRWCSSGSKSAVARLGDVTKLNAQIECRSVEVLAACAGVAAELVHAESRLGELQRSFLDPSRAADELAGTPGTDLDAGLERKVSWCARDRLASLEH